MPMANVAEDRRQSAQTEGVNSGNDGGNTQTVPRPSTTAEVPQAGGAQLNINGNVSHSQIRQNTTHVPQIPLTFRAAAKEPSVPQRSSETSTTGSSQRKRSRMGEEGGQQSIQNLTKLQDYINSMNGHIDNLQKNGQRGNTGLIRIQMTNCMREIMSEVTNILTKTVNEQSLHNGHLRSEKQLKDKIICLQEENGNIKQQVIELQLKLISKEQEEKMDMPPTYAQIAHKNIASNIISGRQPPLPHIPQSVKYAPSECIILFKADTKGEMKTKQEQEAFRKEVREKLNMEEQQAISAIRPTRYGGYTLIFYSGKLRDQVFKKLRKKEEERGVEESESKMVAPTKRVAKIVCKDVPNDLSIEQIKKDMYDRHNPALQKINNAHRNGTIYRTRLGLVFELSSYEMAAVQSQGWKISCDLGRELRVEEFISLQQCYACSKFGHSALECKSGEEVCRLCGKNGHAGKDCDEKHNKEAWNCANCHRMNLVKNLNLDTKHAAAQLHKCPVAQQQKNIRKLQLASTGVYTTPIQKVDGMTSARPNDVVQRRNENGTRQQGTQDDTRRKNRSRSTTRTRKQAIQSNTSTAQQRGGSSQRLAIGNRNRENDLNEENPCVQRVSKVTRPQIENGWQTVVHRKQRRSGSTEGGRRSMRQTEMSESGQMEEEEEDIMQMVEDALNEDNAAG